MRDITAKIKTLRVATARATLTASPETLARLKTGDLPKGDPLPVAKVAAIQAAKNCSQIIPYCHPLPIDAVDVSFDIQAEAIEILVTVKVLYKTGVEMEALTAASVAALTLYDMMKMVDEGMTIGSVVLVSKKGGKSDYRESLAQSLRGAVLVMSDSIAQGLKEDASGRLIQERLTEHGVTVVDYRIIPDDRDRIAQVLKQYADEEQIDLVLTTGGTGMSPRDNTPEAMDQVIEREVPGIVEALRAYGQERMPYSMLSRGRAGVRGRTLIVNLPGSKNGVRESLDALLPTVFHAFKILRGASHPEASAAAGSLS
jgi:molybdenum cofactor biosynthesis protein MoaC